MSSASDERTPYEIIEQEKEGYLEELATPNPEYPPNVRTVHRKLQSRLFDLDLRVTEMKRIKIAFFAGTIGLRMTTFTTYFSSIDDSRSCELWKPHLPSFSQL